jgi:Mg2+-importing ATPase
MVHTTVMVVRPDGAGNPEGSAPPAPREVPLEQVVPGDIAHLSAGAMIPGDLRLIVASSQIAGGTRTAIEIGPVEACAVHRIGPTGAGHLIADRCTAHRQSTVGPKSGILIAHRSVPYSCKSSSG